MSAVAPAPAVPAGSPSGKLMFIGPDSDGWRELRPEIPAGLPPDQVQKLLDEAKNARDDLKAFLLASLQMQHVLVLAGSGTSLGPEVRGPSMWKLWDHCVNSNPGDHDGKRTPSAVAAKVIADTGYNVAVDGENIEALLSRCEAFLQVKSGPEVSTFITDSKKIILEKCRAFLDPADERQLSAHRTFLHRLSRRRARDSRLKLFTTNYDICFETAAAKLGLVAIDGFSFSQPRHFDPRFFLYDIVRRPTTGDEVGMPLEGVFHLFKLHGSVNWARRTGGHIEIAAEPAPDAACLIYPARGKYQQSYIQPHLELVSQYLSALREPNTCVVVTGFGFNDDHLSEPILAAVQTNPHLRLIVANPSADDLTARATGTNKYWEAMFQLVKQGEDVWMVNSSFGDFAELIPDLKSLTPAQRLARDIRSLAGAK